MKKLISLFVFVIVLITQTYSQESRLDSIWKEVFSDKDVIRDPIEGFWSLTQTNIKSKGNEILNQTTDENIAKVLIYGGIPKNEFTAYITEGQQEFYLMEISKTGAKNRYLCKVYNHGYRGFDYTANILLEDNIITFTVKLNDDDIKAIFTRFYYDNKDKLPKDYSVDEFVRGLKWEYKYTLYKTFPIN
jgi:hypothetical protein